MLDLNSPDWAACRHAYGDAFDIPWMYARLRAAPREEWNTIFGEFINPIWKSKANG